MKQFKLFLWIAALVVIRTVLAVFFNSRGIMPELLFVFALSYSAYERSLNYVMWVTVICGVLESAMSADPFWIVMLSFAYGAALTYMSYDKMRRVQGFLRAAISAAVFTAAEKLLAHFAVSLSVSAGFIVEYMIWIIALNTVCAAVIYAAAAKCFDIKNTAKKLIIS